MNTKSGNYDAKEQPPANDEDGPFSSERQRKWRDQANLLEISPAPEHDSQQTFWGWHCLSSALKFVCFYLCVVGVLGWSAQYYPFLLAPLALTPGLIILMALEAEYAWCVTRCQIIACFFEAIAWMAPLALVVLLYLGFLEGPLGLPEQGLCPRCLTGYAVDAFVLAGALEETAKFLAVRRLGAAAHAVEPRALVVYGAAAALGFATAENALYVAAAAAAGGGGGGSAAAAAAAVGAARAATAFPLHAATGTFMGLRLAQRRFAGADRGFVRVLGPPVLLHGTYDFVLFAATYGFAGASRGARERAAVAAAAAVVALLLASYIFLRKLIVQIQNQFPPVDVHSKILEGQVPIPVACCAQMCPRTLMV